MSPLRGKKKKDESEVEKTGQIEEEVNRESSKVETRPEELTPTSWFSKLTSQGDVQNTINSLPDLDMQLYVGNSLVRFVKKGLDKVAITEERSMRPDVIIRISDKAWTELVKMHNLDEFANLYRRYGKTPSHDEFVKVSIVKEGLLSNSGILRSKLFKSLLLI